jgi:GDPmannose 4,6-dehydratase
MQWLMLQQERPKDFVIATGMQYSIKDFIQFSASELGLKINFSGTKENEIGWIEEITENQFPNLKVGDEIIRVDKKYFRPSEVETLLGDSSKAREELGWKPEIAIQNLCKEMIAQDLKDAKEESLLREHNLQS